MHYNFVEIGTSDFETCIQSASSTDVGLSVDCVEYYLSRLPDKPLVHKVLAAVSDCDGVAERFHMTDATIAELNLPYWVRGCSTIGKPHPAILQFLHDRNLDPEKYLERAFVRQISMVNLLQQFNVDSCDYLKIDTEGHDCVILRNYVEAIKQNITRPAKTIRFESNGLAPEADVDYVIKLLNGYGYEVQSRGFDTVLVRKELIAPAASITSIDDDSTSVSFLSSKKYTIGFFIEVWTFRGTGDSTLNFARYNQDILGNKSIIFARLPSDGTNIHLPFLARVSQYFKIVFVRTKLEATELCNRYNVDAMYFQLPYNRPEQRKIIEDNCPDNIVKFFHVVFEYHPEHVTEHDQKTTVYAGVSQSVLESSFVNLIVEFDTTTEDMRSQLNIPTDAVVFGRHGGHDTFNPDYVVDAVIEVATQHPNVYFLFMPKPWSLENRSLPPNILFLPVTVDAKEKRKFVNTCNAMIHAKDIGESFGIACMEFSAANKPVLTHYSKFVTQNQHIVNLGSKAWIFNDKQSCIQQMNTLIRSKDEVNMQNWNVADAFTPTKCMKQFQDVFIAKIDQLNLKKL